MLNVMVTAVGGDLGISIIRCLRGMSEEMKIIGCDMNPFSAGRPECDDFLTSPSVTAHDNYVDFMREACLRFDLDYIFPMSNVEIDFISKHRKHFADLDAEMVINAAGIIDTFMDKLETTHFFKRHGIAVPETFCAEDYDGRLGFPVILKLRQGSGSQGLFRVADAEELQFYKKRRRNMIVQQWIPGDDEEYTSCIFVGDGKRFFITFRRKLAPGGFSGFVELTEDPGIQTFLDRVTDALEKEFGFNGSVNIQFRKYEGVCYPFEINPRFSSTVYFRFRFGFTDVAWTLDMLRGKPLAYTPLYTGGIGVKTYGEVFFDLS